MPPVPASASHVEVLASSARTATVDSASQRNDRHKGGHFIIDVTATSATPSITPKIQGYDATSDSWYDILVGSAISSTGTNVLKVHPDIEPSANAAAKDLLPGRWRVRVEHADTDSITYSVGVNLVAG